MEAKDGEPRILIGTADPGMSNAELYGFERLRAAHAKTGAEKLPLDRSDYERLLAKVAAFFDRQGVPVTLHEVALVTLPRRCRRGGADARSSSWAWPPSSSWRSSRSRWRAGESNPSAGTGKPSGS